MCMISCLALQLAGARGSVGEDEMRPLQLGSKRSSLLPAHVDYCVWDVGKDPVCTRDADQDKYFYSGCH